MNESAISLELVKKRKEEAAKKTEETVKITEETVKKTEETAKKTEEAERVKNAANPKGNDQLRDSAVPHSCLMDKSKTLRECLETLKSQGKLRFTWHAGKQAFLVSLPNGDSYRVVEIITKTELIQAFENLKR